MLTIQLVYLTKFGSLFQYLISTKACEAALYYLDVKVSIVYSDRDLSHNLLPDSSSLKNPKS